MTEEKIKTDLIQQLKKNGLSASFYQSLVDDYISMWRIKNKLLEDIEKRGVSIPWSNGPKQGGFKKNDSLTELNRINGSMLKILSDLGLRGANVEPEKEKPKL